MFATIETAAFAAAATVAMGYTQSKSPNDPRVPRMLIATVAAISQRLFSYGINSLNESKENRKKFDTAVAIGTGVALAKPLTKALAQDLNQTTTAEEALGTAPIHPGVFIGVGSATTGALVNAFDYLSPAKVLTRMAEFPSKKFPLGGYLMTLGLSIKAIDKVMKTVQPLMVDQASTDLAFAFLSAATAGTITTIVLTDLATPSPKNSQEKR